MKTLFWTGSLCQCGWHGQAAIWRWWNYYHQHAGALGITHWAVFNDGPENLPNEFMVSHWDGDNLTHEFLPSRMNLVSFKSHQGRLSIHKFPGFWRNLITATKACLNQGFDRFILVEYDCVIMSADMLYEVGRTSGGLTCYWCPTYEMPETGVVICGRDRFQRTIEQAESILAMGEPGPAQRFEVAMDWTEIRKHRKGDRYPEFSRLVPPDAEYVCQLPINAYLAWGRAIELI